MTEKLPVSIWFRQTYDFVKLKPTHPSKRVGEHLYYYVAVFAWLTRICRGCLSVSRLETHFWELRHLADERKFSFWFKCHPFQISIITMSEIWDFFLNVLLRTHPIRNSNYDKLFNRRECNNWREAQPNRKLLHSRRLNNDHCIRARRRSLQPEM